MRRNYRIDNFFKDNLVNDEMIFQGWVRVLPAM